MSSRPPSLVAAWEVANEMIHTIGPVPGTPVSADGARPVQRAQVRLGVAGSSGLRSAWPAGTSTASRRPRPPVSTREQSAQAGRVAPNSRALAGTGKPSAVPATAAAHAAVVPAASAAAITARSRRPISGFYGSTRAV